MSPRRCLWSIAATFALLLLAAQSALAGTANAGVRGASRANPLAGIPWGTFTGDTDGVYPAYAHAKGRDKQLLAKIALRPLAFWFGDWFSPSYARTAVEDYIANVTAGNPDVLAQVTVFRVSPWEQDACTIVPSHAEQASYRSWIDNFALGIGSSRVALILQPDLPFGLCSPDPHVPLGEVAYAAKRFSQLPHTTVYIDVGAADWASVSDATWLLEHAGIRYARGFALNDTHYDSNGNELRYGARISHRLGAAGIRNRHFVINTAENGAPFLFYLFHGDQSNPRVCRNRRDTYCATLGIPPTSDVSSRRWGLSGSGRALAARYADAFLWIGRPWLDDGAWPFDSKRSLGLAASTPF